MRLDDNYKKPISVVFFLNTESSLYVENQNPSKITIGDTGDHTVDGVCAEDVTDTGWYACPDILSGDYITLA